MVRVRPACPDDAGTIARIWYDGWREAHLGRVPEALHAARTAESFGERAAERIAETAVAVVADEIAGFVMVVADEVEQVYVATAHRGTAVAAALLAEAERLVGENGHEQPWLAVIAANERARRFYTKNGWSDAGPFEYLASTAEGHIRVAAHRYVKALGVS